MHMQDACSGNIGMIKIGGIKLSQELAQFNLFGARSVGLLLTPYLRRMAENRVNLTFLSIGKSEAGSIGSFCVAACDLTYVRQLVEGEMAVEHRIEVIAPVGTITIFPHQRSFALLGSVIIALGKAGIPIHAICTSLSSLAINTDYRFLDRTVDELLKILDLPSNHAPFRSEFDPNGIDQ
jgi:aspartokinase